MANPFNVLHTCQKFISPHKCTLQAIIKAYLSRSMVVHLSSQAEELGGTGGTCPYKVLLKWKCVHKISRSGAQAQMTCVLFKIKIILTRAIQLPHAPKAAVLYSLAHERSILFVIMHSQWNGSVTLPALLLHLFKNHKQIIYYQYRLAFWFKNVAFIT